MFPALGALVNLADVLKYVAQIEELLKKIAPTKWKGSKHSFVEKTDDRTLKVTKVDTGHVNDNLWVEVQFNEKGKPRVLRAEMKAAQVGTRGGDDKIALDGVVCDKPDFVIGHRVGFGYVRVVLEFHIHRNGKEYNYRFDGDVV